jgi:hypothetical protein
MTPRLQRFLRQLRAPIQLRLAVFTITPGGPVEAVWVSFGETR